MTRCGSAPSQTALPKVFDVAGLLSEPGVGLERRLLGCPGETGPGSLNGLTLPEETA